jgi:hypothetical protein
MAQSLMRPLSKSMSENARLLTPHRPSKMREIERQKREKAAALKAQQEALQKRKMEGECKQKFFFFQNFFTSPSFFASLNFFTSFSFFRFS